MPEPITRNLVFISYSHKDEKWLNDLKTHLVPLIRERDLQVWDDTHIKPGDIWRDEIVAALAKDKSREKSDPTTGTPISTPI